MPVSVNTARVFELLQQRENNRRELSLASLLPTDRPLTSAQKWYSVARSKQYRSDNRYSDVLSYDRTSVQFGHPDDHAINYINANEVPLSIAGRWIAAQAPVPSALSSYFHAIYHDKSLTDWHENGRLKADPYLPNNMLGDRQVAYGGHRGSPDLTLETIREERIDRLGSKLTHASLYPSSPGHGGSGRGGPKDIRHYLFESWPDHGVPSGVAVDQLKALIFEVGQEIDRLGDATVWVHCSAGVGRTGAYLALSSLLLSPTTRAPDISPLGPLPAELRGDKVAETVDWLREYRGLLVQNAEQLQLIYDMTT